MRRSLVVDSPVGTKSYVPAGVRKPTTHRNLPRHFLWPSQPGVGNIAINDAFMLEGAIYYLLKKHFRQENYYVDLLELFHDVRERFLVSPGYHSSPGI